METPCSALSPPPDAKRIRAVIQKFLKEDRLQPKLDKLKPNDEAERQRLLANHAPGTWIADAAQRVGQIQQVTHALKFSHPDAKGSSLSSGGNPLADRLEVGSHSVAGGLAPDVVGNAAALDVYKFLRLDVDGRSLLDLVLTREPALTDALAAYADDADTAQAWIAAFATLPDPNGGPSSHKLAKQLYWPLADGSYHLLSPLFSTSLVHKVWSDIRRDRFSDEAKAARDAYREQRHHSEGFREYPDLAIQIFGGSNKQNISQLNSERNGENWLLPSLPPQWQSPPIQPPLNTDSVFSRRFGQRRQVRLLIRALRDFLERVAKRNNIQIRDTRAELVDEICDELLQFAAEIHSLAPGWSRESRLNEAEQCWLDPERAALDEDFAALCLRGDWVDLVCLRFSNWLNASLRTEQLRFSDVEAEQWQRVFHERLNLIRWELGHED